jgi:uncharacterized protein YjbK
MAAPREIECKYLLETREQFDRFLQEVGAGKVVKPLAFVNHFFDTRTGCLAGRHSALRIRTVTCPAARQVCTLKTHRTETLGVQSCNEFEAPTTVDPTQLLPSAVLDPACLPATIQEALPAVYSPEDGALLHVGCFSTERFVVDCGDGLVVEADVASFPRPTAGTPALDFEIEAELRVDDVAPEVAMSALQARIEAMLVAAQCPVLRGGRSKAARMAANLLL